MLPTSYALTNNNMSAQTKVATKAEVVATVQETLSKFFCDICSKGYANVAQWEEHLLSYGHNHAKRKKEVAMQSRSIKNNADEIHKRREKEKKREQKELERILKATGGSVPSASTSSAPTAGSGATPLSAAGALPAAPPPEKKKGGFFKIANTSASLPTGSQTPPPPPSEPSSVPPPPPPSFSAVQPPPPPTGGSSLASSAPRFTSSKASSLQATWTSWQPPPPTIVPSIPPPPPTAGYSHASGRASTWKPTAAPALHPLLAGDTPGLSTGTDQPGPPSTSRWQSQARDQRNDFFRRDEERSQTAYELPTAASTTNTTRAPKGMSFVSATTTSRVAPTSLSSSLTSSQPARTPGISLASNAPIRKKVLDMHDDDDEEDEGESGMPLPTGRPKARMSGSQSGGNMRGKIGFGSMGR